LSTVNVSTALSTMNSSSSGRDDDDDCFSVQLDGSDMSPKAPKVCCLSASKEILTSRFADYPPTEIHHETI